MLQPTLPGVFLNNPIMPAVNGALWTIKIEVMFYCAVPVLVYFMRKYNKVFIITTIYILSFIYALAFDHIAALTGKKLYHELAKQLPGQLSYFISGTLIYYYFDVFSKHNKIILLMGIVGYFLTVYSSIFNILAPISLAILVLYFAFIIPDIGFIRRFGDLSYGTYLYHFPIIQTALCYNLFEKNVYLSVISILIGLLILSLLSWNLWEKPFLQKGKIKRDCTI